MCSSLCRPEATAHSLQIGQPADPSTASVSVVSDTSEFGAGTFATTLHSGVFIRNDTGVGLEVGTQTPLGAALGEPHALGALAPGEATWLPALRAEAAMLCVRPTSSYRPTTLPSLPPLALRQLGGGGGGRLPASSLSTSGVVYRSSAQLASQADGAGEQRGHPPAAAHWFEWSSAVPVAHLLPQQEQQLAQLVQQQRPVSSGGGASRPRLPKHVSCAPCTEDSGLPLVLSVGASRAGERREDYILFELNFATAPPQPYTR